MNCLWYLEIWKIIQGRKTLLSGLCSYHSRVFQEFALKLAPKKIDVKFFVFFRNFIIKWIHRKLLSEIFLDQSYKDLYDGPGGSILRMHFLIANRHFSIVNRHFLILNIHFSISNRHFLIVNRHFCFYDFGTSALHNFDTSALCIFDTSALYIAHILRGLSRRYCLTYSIQVSIL